MGLCYVMVNNSIVFQGMSISKILNQKFFNKSAVSTAKKLLGKFLVRKIGKRKLIFMITEVEAYDGFKDRASHASRGKTKRNFPMFGPAGFWYVYFTYGMHWMLNIVTGKKNYPAAVLIRGLENITGPARLTKKLKITGKFNNLPANKKTGLWIEDRGLRVNPAEIKSGPRVGVDYAGPYWSKKRWRFWIETRGRF